MTEVICLIIGLLIGYWQSTLLQNREFKKQKKEDAELIENLLKVLIDDLQAYYNLLFSQPNGYAVADFRSILLNHQPLNFENKKSIWPILVSKKIFGDNRECFEKINLITQKLEQLNCLINVLKPEWHVVNDQKIEVRNARDIMESIKRLYDQNLSKPFKETHLYVSLNKLAQGTMLGIK